MRRAASQVKAAAEWGHPTRAGASFQIVHFKIIVPECCISSETFGTPNQEECHAHPPPRLPHPGVFPNSPIRASLEHDSQRCSTPTADSRVLGHARRGGHPRCVSGEPAYPLSLEADGSPKLAGIPRRWPPCAISCQSPHATCSPTTARRSSATSSTAWRNAASRTGGRTPAPRK